MNVLVSAHGCETDSCRVNIYYLLISDIGISLDAQ